jgi:hypothetical protein
MVSMNEIIKALAWLIGGGFLVKIIEFYFGRAYRKTLIINIDTTSTGLDNRRMLVVNVQFTNAGKGKIKAKPVKTSRADEYAYKNKIETVRYSGSLQIKELETAGLQGNKYLDWFDDSVSQEVSGIKEINLLDEYILTDKEGEIDFWLEPGETVHLATPLVLSPGNYLLKVSFYGPKADDDFWHRLIFVRLE